MVKSYKSVAKHLGNSFVGMEDMVVGLGYK